MVRVRFRDGVRRRPHYGLIGKFDADGLSLRHWPRGNVPFLRRFFTLNQHRLWFEVVEATEAKAAVAVPDSAVVECDKPSDTPIAGGGEAVPLPAETPPASTFYYAKSEADDADHVECEVASGDDPQLRPEPSEGDAARDGHLGTSDRHPRQGRRAKRSNT